MSAAQGVHLDAAQAKDYLMGRDLVHKVEDKSGESCVFFDGHCLGLAKVLPKKIKNNLPRQLVRDNVIFV